MPDHDIVHGAYPLKKDKPEFHVEYGTSVETNKYGLWRTYAAGCGFVMIKRDLLEYMQDQYPELYYRNRHLNKPMYALFDHMIVEPKDGSEPMYLGEDVAFFRRARECQAKMWCDPTIRLQHIGMKTYDADLADLVNFVSPETDTKTNKD